MNSRSLLLAGWCAASLCGSAFVAAAAAEKTDFSNHPFFKLLIGDWKSEGKLKAADGREVAISEEWTGKATAEGTFVMTGRRVIGDDPQEFEWTLSHNANTGSWEAVHEIKAKPDQTKRFEVSVSEVELTTELQYHGDGGASITLKDAFAGKERDVLESEVTLTGVNGETTLSGKITHKRIKKP